MLVILTSHPIQYQTPIFRSLAKSGIEFEVWFLTPHGVDPSHDAGFGKSFAWDIDLLEGYPSRFLNVAANWDLRRFLGIQHLDCWKDLLAERHVTHLWVEGWRFSVLWQAVFAAKRAGIQIWMRGDTNDLLPRTGLKGFVRSIALSRLFKKIDYFLCVGNANRRLYKSFGVSEKKLVLTPHCVDNDRFAASALERRSRRDEIRRNWGIPEDGFCILFCGKFIDVKRPSDLVNATALANQNTHILFAGDGPLGNALHQSVSVKHSVFKYATNPTINRPTASFVGFLNQKEISDAYVAADCLVLPSFSESWGLVINEAMASGLPCIASNQCGCAEDLLSPEFVFRMGNIESLVSCINRMQENPPLVAEIADKIQRFHISVTVQTVAQLLCNDISAAEQSSDSVAQ